MQQNINNPHFITFIFIDFRWANLLNPAVEHSQKTTKLSVWWPQTQQIKPKTSISHQFSQNPTKPVQFSQNPTKSSKDPNTQISTKLPSFFFPWHRCPPRPPRFGVWLRLRGVERGGVLSREGKALLGRSFRKIYAHQDSPRWLINGQVGPHNQISIK